MLVVARGRLPPQRDLRAPAGLTTPSRGRTGQLAAFFVDEATSATREGGWDDKQRGQFALLRAFTVDTLLLWQLYILRFPYHESTDTSRATNGLHYSRWPPDTR